MPFNVQIRGNRAQLRVTHRLLPRAFFATFDTAPEASGYGSQLVALLERGIVPADLVAKVPRAIDDPLLADVIRSHIKVGSVTESDDALLHVMLAELVGVRVSGVTYAWAESYVSTLKLSANLAPGTIRKRVGALARAIDWHLRTTAPAGTAPPANALRLLPKGYSVYTRADADRLAAKNLRPKRDVQRDRRLLPGEEQRILSALAGVKRDDRERALAVDASFTMLFRLIVDTGLRLLEAFRLRAEQIDHQRRIINVEGSKGRNGNFKPRVVPIKPALAEHLRAYASTRDGLLFPFWSGQADDLKRCSSRLSVRFASLFDYAQVADLREHDLRHEATCRWVELRRPDGHWAFSDLEICKIMGWSSMAMMLRYASLRGEDLAARLR